MKTKSNIFTGELIAVSLLVITLANSCKQVEPKSKNAQNQKTMTYTTTKSKTEWEALLSPAQFNVLRNKATESPGTGEYNLHFKKGIYSCAGCGTQLFESNNKYESHCGWPSFDDAIPGTINQIKDTSLGMIRIEIVCANCGGHLGHIFDDGPQQTTGKRYCVNSLSLDFEEEK